MLLTFCSITSAMQIDSSANKRIIVSRKRTLKKPIFFTCCVCYTQLFFMLSVVTPVDAHQKASNPFKPEYLTSASSPRKQWKDSQRSGNVVLDESKIKKVAAHHSRFDTPWYVPKRTRFLTLTESRHRVLYSPLRSRSGNGLGHSFSVMNAEIGAALRLGLAYTHRISSYGSLTAQEPSAVEHFFGWGDDQIPRWFIRESFCKSTFDGFAHSCEICEGLKANDSVSFTHFNHLVNVPRELTYSRIACSRIGDDGKREACFQQQSAFLKAYNKSHTIFQMPVDSCGSNPTDGHVDEATRSYLFHQYWSRHAKRKDTGSPYQLKELQQRIVFRGGVPHLHFNGRERAIGYAEDVLNIAIHARRGDFFKVKRKMVSTRAFGEVVRGVMEVVQGRGGVFAEMRVVVHIYSEGKLMKGAEKALHDVTKMDKRYRDSDGRVRDESWVTRTIRGNRRTARKGSFFPGGLQVKFHIAADTLGSLHEMIAADVFIGSLSGMGVHVVTSLSRGIHVMPRRVGGLNKECCSVGFDGESGRINDSMEDLGAFWDGFVRANEASARRALAKRTKQSG